MRLTVLVIAIFILFPSCVTPVVAEVETKSDQIKIGFILPLTGELANLGSGIKNGVILASEDLPEIDKPILFFEDNRGELSLSATATQRLIEVNHVDVIISIISGVAKVVQPIATRAGVISIGICSDPSAAEGQHSFINYLTAEQGVKKFLSYFKDTVGENKSISVLLMNEAGFVRIYETLQQQAQLTSVKIYDAETFNKGEQDFRSFLLRLNTKKPDLLLVLGLSPEIETISRQLNQLQVKTPVASIESIGLARDLTAFEGSWFIDSAIPSPEFQSRYMLRFKTEITPGVGHAYDTVKMLIEAYKKANWKSQFRKIVNFPGVVGNLSVRANGIIWSEASVKKVINGKIEVVTPTE